MKSLSVLLGIFFVVFLVSCESEIEQRDIDYGYDFAPMDLAYFWEYQVDSVVFTEGGSKKDTTSSYVKEEIVEKFIDETQDTVFRIERRFKNELSETGRPIDQWASSKKSNILTRTEENLKYIKMVFPLKENSRWDGNAFLNETTEINVAGETLELFIDWDYRVLSFKEKDTINGIEFSDVVCIQNADNYNPNLPIEEQNKINRRYVIEKFAKGIGLIYKKHLIVDTQCTTVECETIPWEEKAEEGYIMEMSLVNYGK